LEYNQSLQAVIDYIDKNISEDISVYKIAEKSGYSVYHLCHLFSDLTGIPLIAYVTWRKLQFAIYDISQGKKIIDAAMDYGFETHAGFTKAFKRIYGYPPSLYLMHVNIYKPNKTDVEKLKFIFKGENTMNPHIIELTPFSAVGYPRKHTMPGVKNTKDIPAFWSMLKSDEFDLSKLYQLFTKSKHFEVCFCYDVDMNSNEFKYFVGRGIDIPSDLENITEDMTRIDITGGLYAVFSTPPAEKYIQFGPAVPSDQYIQTIQETWNYILQKWLPQSEFEFDESRQDFEYYDYRDHGCYFGGKVQMDICIPICKRC
jgi:AraC family transcriptional regulator